jgi:hypothetical protein
MWGPAWGLSRIPLLKLSKKSLDGSDRALVGMAQGVEKGVSEPVTQAREATIMEPVRSFQTVSLGTSVNKPSVSAPYARFASD